MTKFTQHTGVVAPFKIANIDTDAIIPKQFLQKITRSGFGQHLFNDWRFLDNAGQQPNPDFILNKPLYQKASIILAGENFGCGSSREHAPWALLEFGIRAIIAPSFADIFYGNSLNNHLLPICLKEEEVETLFGFVEKNAGAQITIDLQAQTVQAGEAVYHFEINAFRKHCLLNGLDNIALTLQHEAAITAYEKKIPAFLK